jgi:hypothetical protein
LRLTIYILVICLFSSCAIHHEFPFICFKGSCVKQQFSMKPLKKRIQIAMGGQKRKLRASQGSSKSISRKSAPSKDNDFKNKSTTDSTRKDSVASSNLEGYGLTVMDTVVRIYYEGLTDSVLNMYKKIIQSFVSRTGTNHISEISLTDYYSKEGFTEVSVKSDIGDYLLKIGVSKYRVLWSKNKCLKPENEAHWPKKLLYLEIRFH